MQHLSSTVCALSLSWAAGSVSAASEVHLLPRELTLTGPQAAQRLVVEERADGQWVRDLTAHAQFSSSNPKVATVEPEGVVRPAGDGHATITTTVDGRQATAMVTVKKFHEPLVPSFRNDVIPILTKIGCNSGACHGALAGKGGMKLSLRGYDPLTDHFVLTRQAGGRRVDLATPERSLVLLKPTATIRHGGGRRVNVPSPAFHILADWIAAGSPGPEQSDPKVERLETLPASVMLGPGASQQVIVRAHYSDGQVRDVTPWVKFASTQDLVATVDDAGQVSVSGHGEAAITGIYSGLVTFARIASPYPYEIDPNVFEEAQRNNFVDELVLRKLQTLQIPPSRLCTDNEFIRRAYLDAAGILPTPKEIEQFENDTASEKRARLIDQLLERPEFVDYWAYKWSDLLLISSERLPKPAMWAFYNWVRKSVADNKPWDRFANELLTATGSTLTSGAANYFALHKDVTDLTETTSVTFMGMSITCARCHNHPLEKWTQNQYYGMANLFSRVRMKNGQRAGDLVVFPSASGEIPHPRTGVPMAPQPLDADPVAHDAPGDRRQYFAQWLTRPDNPFFARALVNRVWRNFLGRGLVEAEDDLRLTNPASNEDLFAALAEDFVRHGYDLKHLVRTITNSATYQCSSVAQPENTSDDRYYSHYLVRRLPAEVILDAYSSVTGVPTNFDGYPVGMRALQLPDSKVASYFLTAFGRPDRVQACSCERQQDSSVTQALHLNNGDTLNNKLKSADCRIEQWLEKGVSNEEVIRRVFLLALARHPTDSERQKLAALMGEADEESASEPKGAQQARRIVLEDLFWAVLTDREFLFNH